MGVLDPCSIFQFHVNVPIFGNLASSPKAFHSAYWLPRCRNFRARLAKENGTWQRQDLCTELDVQQQVVAPRNMLQQREAKIGGYDKHRDNHSICFRAAGLRLVDHTSQEPTDAALNTDVSAASALFLTRWPCLRWKVYTVHTDTYSHLLYTHRATRTQQDTTGALTKWIGDKKTATCMICMYFVGSLQVVIYVEQGEP